MIEKLIKLLGWTIEPKHVEIITDTTTHTGLNGFAITAIENSVIESITYIQGEQTVTGTVAGETIVAGATWYIRHSQVKLTSGAIISSGK